MQKSEMKTREASLVLQLIDEDFSYQEAINYALFRYPFTNYEQLEEELNFYC